MTDNKVLQSIVAEIDESISVKQLLKADASIIGQIHALAEACLASLKNGGKVIFAGNGGSFADAQHLSAEFTSRFLFDRPALASIALGTNSSAMSAIGNDYGYDQTFAREIQAIAKPEDIFVAISTSGNSLNIVNAVAAASELDVPVVILTGASGGKLKSLASCICVPSSDTARIQESHILIGHIVCGMVERLYFPQHAKVS
ncbi:MAG: D-sedoheptulose 7-phosphate isomerase [Candidatus Azotimanducaceae bacterium]|jgi:D-sedoheptulose 7-phosphate isomerase